MNILIIFVIAMMVVGECRKSGFPVKKDGCPYECYRDRYCLEECKSLGAIGGFCMGNRYCVCSDLPDNVPTSSPPKSCSK
uniref:Neurotoxin LmNaTx13 n=1 Tax=Lychas mucronatus TaxID=172552 RepID=A0A0U1S504_LYCMC|nr:neurotoxin LmNaTx13 precursor [Lychas mucronatus]